MPTLENSYALIVGIANYQHVKPLPAAILNDTQAIYDVLVDPQLCAYPSANVTLLQDTTATKEALHQALTTLAEKTNSDSTVFIYFSSHGGQIEGRPGAGEYLLPVDAQLTTPATTGRTAISGTEFTAYLNRIAARKVVVVFDCCHAGGIGQPKDAQEPLFKDGIPESYYEQLQKGRGRVILASSRSSERSWVLSNDTYSLFTKHLLAGLRGGVPSEDGLIRTFDLFEYIQPRVTSDHAQQHPIFKAEIEENFAVALYLGQQKGVIRKDAAGFRYDAYISYVDQGADSEWVWDTLVPRLEAAGLRIAVSDDAENPGVARVVSIERGIKQSKRTVIVLSHAYLADNMANFQNTLAQTMGIQEGSYRLLPVKIEEIDNSRLPIRLSMLATLNLVHPSRAEREFERLIQALQRPLPTRV